MEPDAKPKIGQAALPAAGRLGIKEIAQILPAFPDSVRTQDDPGLWGNATQREVYEQRNSPVIESRDLYGKLDADVPQLSQPDPNLEMEHGLGL